MTAINDKGGEAVIERQPSATTCTERARDLVATFIAGEVGWGPTDGMVEQADDLLNFLYDNGFAVLPVAVPQRCSVCKKPDDDHYERLCWGAEWEPDHGRSGEASDA